MVQDTLLGFPTHTLHPQGVCGIRKAEEPLTAALPYRRGEFTTLSTVSIAIVYWGAAAKPPKSPLRLNPHGI